jgi:hypothetical protein
MSRKVPAKKKDGGETTTLAKSYEPTPHDRKIMQAYFEEQRENPPPPRLKAVRENSGTLSLAPDHPDIFVGVVLLLDAIGLKDPNLGRELLRQMAAVADGHEDALNAMIAFVKGLQPRDALEAALATQMAAVHALGMRLASQLVTSKTHKGQEHAERALNKLSRTFTIQMEALKRYRTGGEQKVTVQHVSVNDNAQAIVGNVSTGVGGDKKS